MVEMKFKTNARKLSDAMGWSIDPRLEAFVARGLSRDPSQRFPTALDALDAWRELRVISPMAQSSKFSGLSESPFLLESLGDVRTIR
jgi:eukaryotic-like serine/threonine-protein kinase